MKPQRFAMVLAVSILGAANAMAQAPLDATDPSITKKPSMDPERSQTEPYPVAAKRNLIEGDTKVRMCVDAAGKVTSAEMASSSGNAFLDEASLRWARKTRLIPAEAAGVAVAVCNYQLTYTWTLDAQTRVMRYRQYHLLREQDRPVMVVAAPAPDYPPIALEHRIAEKVPLSLCIGPTGTVELVTFENLKGNGNLAVATVKWVMASQFKPGAMDGKPVGVCGLKVSYDWKLPE